MRARSAPTARLALLLLACLSCPLIAPAGQAADRVGAERCGECHEREYRHWSQTLHARLLTESDDETVLELTDEIPDALGIDDLETDPACAGCHFSQYRDDAGDERIAAVDCESCHGAASGWLDVHSDYGSSDGRRIEDADQEDPAHRKRRLSEAKGQGMYHPGAIVSVTQNCLECHVGPGERIVNVGGHASGSDFELVACFDEYVRHNFHRTNQRENAPLGKARRRQLYVVGRALDLEYSLRALSRATEDGRYLRSARARVRASRDELERILNAQAIAEVEKMLRAASTVELSANNQAAATLAADRIHSATLDFAVKHNGDALADLDRLVPARPAADPHRSPKATARAAGPGDS